jgi:hypothetical protein
MVVLRLHEGARKVGPVDTINKKCEVCQLKRPSFGLPVEGMKRWCSGCAKGHAGVVDAINKKCEGCQLKEPSFGLSAEGRARWCSGCAKAHVRAYGKFIFPVEQ